MTEVERRAQVLLGNACLERGRLYDAFRAFKAAGDKQKLIICGNACLEQGDIRYALAVFKAAGDKEKLLA